ncbi:hypothetical protein MCEMRE26_01068 [Candidatus Nanopelagicaceae bacterium]
MKFLISIFFGAFNAIAATLIHQSIPPFGVAIAIGSTFTAIWWIGRRYGKKRYKFLALFAWLLVIIRAGTFGAGQELLIQGDNAGSALLLIGFLAGLLAALKRV